MGRAPIADVADLAERHFGLDILAWPTGTGVSGLCAHGRGVVIMLVSTAFTRGHQRFTAAHELAHHLLGDPREVVIDSGLYDDSNPIEKRANAFAAALLMPAAGHGLGCRRRPARRGGAAQAAPHRVVHLVGAGQGADRSRQARAGAAVANRPAIAASPSAASAAAHRSPDPGLSGTASGSSDT